MNTNSSPPIAVTAQALSLLSEIAAKHPELPAPYFSLSTNERSVWVSFQCDSLPAFELWRAALGVATQDVKLSVGFLGADLPTVPGWLIRIHLYAAMPPTLMSERPAAEWEARLASLPSDWRAERARLEDPHSSTLHHAYTIPHDLPAIPHQQDRRAM